MAPNSNKNKNKILENSKSKVPSSYPLIYKYPAYRDDPFKTSVNWILGKRKDDNIGNYWRVHDKLYNLEEFIEKHPGGRDWIDITRGTDITEAFEASHLINVKKVEGILSKYYVKNAVHPRNSPFTFKEDGFYKSLKRKVEPILKEVGTSPSFKILLIQDSLLLSFIIFTLFGVGLNSTFLQILAGFSLAFNTICSHNFFHLKDNFRQFYFDVSFMSSYEWRISHYLSHHLYTNTIMDAEISFFEPIFKFLPNKNKNWVQRKLAGIYFHPVAASLFFAEFLRRNLSILQGKQKFRPEYCINFLELLIYIFIAPNFKSGINSWIFIHIFGSYIFLLIGLNAAHHHPSTFHDGDEPRKDTDFGLCQLDAVRDRAGPLHRNTFIIMISFGNHTLHHLFPTICHSKIEFIEPIFQKHLKEFAEIHPKYTQWEHFIGTLKQMDRSTPNKIDN